MALEHGGRGAECAAKLLLSIQYGMEFNLSLLLSLDCVNRAHVDNVFLGYAAFDVTPSKWIGNAGGNGNEIMQKLAAKWN